MSFSSFEQRARINPGWQSRCTLWVFCLPSLISIFLPSLYPRSWPLWKISPGLSSAGFHLGLNNGSIHKRLEAGGKRGRVCFTHSFCFGVRIWQWLYLSTTAALNQGSLLHGSSSQSSGNAFIPSFLALRWHRLPTLAPRLSELGSS